MNRRWRILALLLLWVGLFLGTATPAGAEESAPADDPVVRVGTEGTYPPFTFHDPDTDELTGYDIEVIKEVAKTGGLAAGVRRGARSTRSSRRSTPTGST